MAIKESAIQCSQKLCNCNRYTIFKASEIIYLLKFRQLVHTKSVYEPTEWIFTIIYQLGVDPNPPYTDLSQMNLLIMAYAIEEDF